MTEELVIEILQLLFRTTAILSAPIILTIVAVGLIANILQAVTQLKDQALAFVPKVFIVGLVFVLLTPWYIQTMEHFTQTIFDLIERAAL